MTEISNIIEAFAKAKTALDKEPEYQSAIRELVADNDSLRHTVQDRELAIVSNKKEIEELYGKVRSLEVERDNALFRTLELEDTVHKALEAIRFGLGHIDGARDLLDPPKPQPEPVVEPAPSPEAHEASYGTAHTPEGQRDPLPISDYAFQPESGSSYSPPSSPPPTADPVGFTESELSQPVPEAPTPPDAPTGPYTGKNWSEVKHLMSDCWSISEWRRGGGSEAGWNS